MFADRKSRNPKTSPYISKEAFCRIFEKDMGHLYLLCFLLTGEEAVAEQCFIEGLHVTQEANAVFEEWAEAWACRTVILNAIRLTHPRMGAETSQRLGRVAAVPTRERPEITAILELPTFERFVFVMSVLEGYSEHECALHLDCMRADVKKTRIRALEGIRSSTLLHRTPGEYQLGSEERVSISSHFGMTPPPFSPLTGTRS